MLDNGYALLFIRGERPIIDLKFDLLKHPNISDTADGKAEPYVHGEVTKARAAIELVYADPQDLPVVKAPKAEYEILSEEDLERIYGKMEEDK